MLGCPRSPSNFAISYSQDQVIAPGIPRQLGGQSMVLVAIAQEVRKDHIGVQSAFNDSKNSLTSAYCDGR